MGEPSVPPITKNFRRWIVLVMFMACGVACVFKQSSSQATAFAIVFTLMAIGGLVLWDHDRWRKAGRQHGPIALHIMAMVFAVCVSTITNTSVYRGLPPLLVRVFVCSFLATILFLLMELATDPIVRKDEFHSLPGATCILTYLVATPNPLFVIGTWEWDWMALALFVSGFSAGGVSMFSRDLDSVPLERRYLYIWFGISMLVLVNWMIRPF